MKAFCLYTCLFQTANRYDAGKPSANTSIRKMKNLISTLSLGIIFPTILFLASPYWSSLFTDSKKLEYRIVRSINISQIDKEDPLTSELKVEYKGKEIPNGMSTTVIIVNTGQTPIKREDIDTTINIITSGSPILASQVINSYPDDLAPEVSHNENKIIIQPLLLNPNDFIAISFLTDGKTQVDRISARIAGIDSIVKMQDRAKEGFAIKYIEPGDREGSTLERNVISISVSIAGATGLVFLTSALYFFLTILRENSITKVVLRLILAVTLELSALSIFTVPTTYLNQSVGLTPMAVMLIKYSLFAICAVIAFKIRKLYYPPQQPAHSAM
ncbi:hypothetical protein [Pseudomonas sp. MWU12-2029]|uniref:hypothetical protein n=1 Tax=Pseudomonas sp. MWU12-2029 TaxID=2927805 RepID=UPI00200FFAE3|nr:hypothetical protein [Pseudomonas sp. MWU12-2029]